MRGWEEACSRSLMLRGRGGQRKEARVSVSLPVGVHEIAPAVSWWGLLGAFTGGQVNLPSPRGRISQHWERSKFLVPPAHCKAEPFMGLLVSLCSLQPLSHNSHL